MNTYKFHAMGAYVSTIKLFGSIDSFTTQMGELVHRALKAFYLLTSKLDTPAQLARHEHRQRVLQQVAEARGASSPGTQLPADAIPSASLLEHHHIANNFSHPVSIFQLLREHNDDPAIKNFMPKLKDHILYRLQKLDISYCDHVFTDKEHNLVIIPNNTLYSVQTMQTHADVMVIPGETMPSHPYWYAHVLGIYHMQTWLNDGSRPVKQHLQLLWVQWLTPLQNHKSGIKHTHLPKVATSDLRGPLNSSHLGRELKDWEEYYVGIFSDRDMFMRYTHLGVGDPVALRKIIQDCLTSADSDDLDIIDDAEHDLELEVSDSEDQEECSDDKEEGSSKEEIENEDEGDCDRDDGRGDEDMLDWDVPLSF
ncbi:hypothetical protein BDR05DRAFT_1003940 [Suillus weaverae]|nr:hypothetical protein BDR05DRAFT_1003940 [Suillus weaverae]